MMGGVQVTFPFWPIFFGKRRNVEMWLGKMSTSSTVFLKLFAIAYQPVVFYYTAYHLAPEELILLKFISIYYIISPVNNTQNNLM